MATPTFAKHQRVTGPARNMLITMVVRRYGNGESIRTIAASLGRSYGAVHRLLREGQAALRPRGGVSHRARNAATTVEPPPCTSLTASTAGWRSR